MITQNARKWLAGRRLSLLVGALAALVVTFALNGVSDAAGNLTFGDAPTGWSVTSGEANGNIGKIQASGVKKKRIRYSISGASGFSVKGKTGVVSYDGSAVSSDVTEALVTVTARDRKAKVSDASVTITVSIAQPEPVVEVKRIDPVPPAAQPHEQHEAHEHVKVKVNTRRPMIAEGHRQAVMVRFTADVKDGISAEYRIVDGGHAHVRPNSGKWLSKLDGFELDIDKGVLEYTGSGTPFEGTGSRELTVSGQKDYYEYFLQVEVTAAGYSPTIIDIRVCLLR